MEIIPKLVFLVVLDGFGLSDKAEGNAIKIAKPEFLGKLFSERPFTKLAASGLGVGLPKGQMGNSEVGHLNIGAGRIVYQDIARINKSIEDGSFFNNQVLIREICNSRDAGKAIHITGLLSDGGVHSHTSHLFALLELLKKLDAKNVFLHVFTDGRDTSTTSGVHFMRRLCEKLKSLNIGKIASISGRYFGMDRDQRWERIEKSYLAMVHGVGNRSTDPILAMEASYKTNVTDEFIVPLVIEHEGKPIGVIDNGDTLISINFRSDRMRQILKSFTDSTFSSFGTKDLALKVISFTKYSHEFNFPVVFPSVNLEKVLGELLSENKVPQFRCTETEKYAHITYFMNGGREESFPFEERLLIPSPKVKTYDLKPEMSAFEIGDALMEKLNSKKFPVVMTNLANCDMIGHTGNLKAAVEAVHVVDCVLSKIIPVAYDHGYDCIITSDHGNVEKMLDEMTGEPFTEHTLNPVPFCLLTRENYTLAGSGNLADIAPTILELLKINKPEIMDGKSLLRKK
ncbi:MAG: 2,3-bisphosphoglycerate-independent phosphoglycerate mutase [Candidatus Riflebacteria bacterium]|nr:2,3-bisphosphoglycerate-independent phosphoglycerate mutase [Candidatus Riflebacteria bacterium]